MQAYKTYWNELIIFHHLFHKYFETPHCVNHVVLSLFYYVIITQPYDLLIIL